MSVGPAGQSHTRDLQVGSARQGKTKKRKRKKVARANGPEVFQRPNKAWLGLVGRLGRRLTGRLGSGSSLAAWAAEFAAPQAGSAQKGVGSVLAGGLGLRLR